MFKVGLTGGIGSGKSTVARIFESLSIPVYYADVEAKKIMLENPKIRQQIIDTFGEKSYQLDQINRGYLSSVIFNDKEKKKQLDNIVHPATIEDSLIWAEKQHTPYTIKEAALIFESHSEKFLDAIIGVSAPLPLRISRVMKRDHLTESEILKKIAAQMEEAEKLKKCNFVIFNDEEQLLIPQVIHIHQALLKKAAEHV